MWKEKYSGKELKNINIQRKLSGVPSTFAGILVTENFAKMRIVCYKGQKLL